MAKLKTDPCWKCTDRNGPCWDNCEKYKAVVEQRKKAKEQLRRDTVVLKCLESSLRKN